MTNEQRAEIMQASAERFIAAADKQYNNNVTISNELLVCEMFGVISGALAVLAASGMPWKNIIDMTSDVVAQMRGERK